MKQFIECKYKYQAVEKCPWATIAKKVWGGYMMFDSAFEYDIWKNQK